MPLRQSAESNEMLHLGWAYLAGGLSLLVAVVHITLLMVLVGNIPTVEEFIWDEVVLPHVAIAMILPVAIGICGVCLMRQRVWAQRALLIFWLIEVVAVVVLVMALMLWSEVSLEIQLASVLMLITIVFAPLLTVVLIVASRSRLRYASMVTVSVMAAIALAILVIMISRKDYYIKTLESLGRYSISERTEKILAGLDRPVRLTCVYTGAEDGRKGSDFRPRIWELLDDLSIKAGKLDKVIEIANITSHAQRRREDTRLGHKQRMGPGQPHEEFLRGFLATAGALSEHIKAEQQAWRGLGDGTYLAQWTIPASLANYLPVLEEGFDRTRQMLRSELEKEGIRNYPALVRPAKSILKSTLHSLNAYRATLGAIAQVYELTSQNHTKALAAVDESVRAVADLAKVVGKPSDPGPGDPAAVIESFIQAAALASDRAYKATKALETVAGPDNDTLVVNSSHWVIKANNNKIGLSEFFAKTSKSMLQLSRRNQQIARISTAKYKAEEVIRLRKQVAMILAEFELARAAAQKALKALITLDKPAGQVLRNAMSGDLFAEIISRTEALTKQADKLPELKATSLTNDLAGDNIVIVEVGDKTEVIAFDKVWPLALRTDDEGKPRRVFNGDSAIASRILSMTREPFATVVFAYVQPRPTPEMVRKHQVHASPVKRYKTLISRLEDANFEVRNWELSQRLTEALKTPTTVPASRGVVLIVLPSTRQAEIAGPYADNLKRAVSGGTPAVFLIESQTKPWGTIPYDRAVTTYLAEEWGIRVASDYVVIPAVRDQDDPDRYRIDDLRNRWMPQSSFSEHVIATGLDGQRLLWKALLACPLEKIDPAPHKGLKVTGLLTVPEDQTTTWATSRFFEVLKQYRTTGFILPNYKAKDKPDLHVPFDLAAVATLKTDPGNSRKLNRVVVLGVGSSFVDNYIAGSVEVHAPNRTTSIADPPGMNADLVVNSVYWLGGFQDRIAAGPMVSKPIDVKPKTRILLMVLCAAGLPLAVLGAGGCILLLRKH